MQGLLFWLVEGGFKVSSGISWYVSSHGTDFDNSEIASPVMDPLLPGLSALGYLAMISQNNGPYSAHALYLGVLGQYFGILQVQVQLQQGGRHHPHSRLEIPNPRSSFLSLKSYF